MIGTIYQQKNFELCLDKKTNTFDEQKSTTFKSIQKNNCPFLSKKGSFS